MCIRAHIYASMQISARVVRVLTQAARAHQGNAAVSAEVCRAIQPAIHALRATNAGTNLVNATGQAVSMLVAVLDVHRDDQLDDQLDVRKDDQREQRDVHRDDRHLKRQSARAEALQV